MDRKISLPRPKYILYATFAAHAFLTACAPAEIQKEPTPIVLSSLPQDTAEIFPEGRALSSKQYEFPTPYSTIRIFNSSNARVNTARFLSVVNHLEQLANSGDVRTYKAGGKNQQVKFIPRPDAKEKNYFLISPQGPWPQARPGQPVSNTAFIRPFPEKNKVATFIRVPSVIKVNQKDPNTISADVNSLLFVELCQSILRSIPAGENSQQLSIEERFTLQEGFCNSYALALILKQRGYNFRDYEALVKPAYGTHPSGKRIPYMVLPENEYSALPQFEAIVE